MDKIREALEQYADKRNWEYGEHAVGRVWREPGSTTPEAYDGWSLASAALKEAGKASSAPVPSDARELAYTIWQIVTQGSGTYWAAREPEAAALIERYAAEQERKAREEERERCIAHIRWMDNPLDTEAERDVIAAIKEAGNGNA